MLNLYVPTVETERLIIRPIEVSDAKDMYEYCQDEETVKFLSFPRHATLEMSEYAIKNFFIPRVSYGIPQAYCLVDKKTNKMIGTCDFHSVRNGDVGEIGYVLNKKYWNQGIMTEALKKVIEVGFEFIGFRRIEIKHSTDNISSKKVIENCGFIYEGTLREYSLSNNGYEDLKIYSILKKEYRKAR